MKGLCVVSKAGDYSVCSDHPRRHGEIADPCPVLVRSLTGEGMASRCPFWRKRLIY